VPDCVALAEALEAPVCNSYLHNDSFPANHRLACGPLGYHGSKAAMHILSKADVVLALGSRLGLSACCRNTASITGRRAPS